MIWLNCYVLTDHCLAMGNEQPATYTNLPKENFRPCKWYLNGAYYICLKSSYG